MSVISLPGDFSWFTPYTRSRRLQCQCSHHLPAGSYCVEPAAPHFAMLFSVPSENALINPHAARRLTAALNTCSMIWEIGCWGIIYYAPEKYPLNTPQAEGQKNQVRARISKCRIASLILRDDQPCSKRQNKPTTPPITKGM